jgi:mRNA interferase RelE/StbE
VTYRVEIHPAAVKTLAALAKADQRRIARKIDGLAKDPRPPEVEKLAGVEGLHRVRSGDYRILYEIQDERVLVLVVRIGHRREVYR